MNLPHRGACGCEVNTGDGAGILIQMPDALPAQGRRRPPLPPAGEYGAGLVFLPRDAERPRAASSGSSRGSSPKKASGCSAGATCRPTTACVGPSAVAVEPVFEQMFIGAASARRPAPTRPTRARSSASSTSSASASSTRSTRCRCRRRRSKLFYILEPLVRARSIYKGMLTAEPDRADVPRPDRSRTSSRRWRSCTSASAPTRSRRGRSRTRTATSRTTARSTRCAATSTGCARARACCSRPCSATTCKKILPVIREGGSDTATFDNVLEFLVMTGRSLPHAILMMIPEPWAGPRDDDAGAARRSTSTTRR